MNEVAKQEAAPTTVIEINGVKLEVDLRSARRIDTLRVGDRVKLLEKTSYGGPIVHHGVVAGFDPFPSQPTIIVAYLKLNYSESTIEFAYLNATPGAENKFELVASIDHELPVEEGEIVAKMDREIAKKQAEIADLERKKKYFLDCFGAYFPEARVPVTVDSAE